MTQILIDTNVLVYAYDGRVPTKQRRAIAALRELREAGTGIVSAQVLSEFYAVATRKLVPPLSPSEAAAQLRAFAAQWPVLPVTQAVVLLAAHRAHAYHLHLWDAQLWATARLHGIALIYSEDFSPGTTLEGVAFANPLSD